MTPVWGFVIGLLVGLLICYYRQAKDAYQNRGIIAAGSNLYDDARTFYDQFRQKF